MRAAGHLVLRDLAHPRVERELGIVRQKRRVLAPAAEAFVHVLREAAAAPAAVPPKTSPRKQRQARSKALP
jgi:hypothetical protein